MDQSTPTTGQPAADETVDAPTSDRVLGAPLVELKHVNKHFGALHVLQDIDLTVRKGEVLVVIGPSGSGKSTLCRAINRLETIDDGTITVDGKTLPEEGKALAQLRAEVGMVFQSFNLFAHKTVLDNVTLGPRKVRGLSKKDAEAEAMTLLERVGVGNQAASTRPALRRAAAARGHRPRARDEAEGHAVRRADLRARPRDGQRGPRRHGVARRGRHDHDRRHARDGLRPQGRAPRGLHGRRPDRRGGSPEEFFTAPKSERARDFLSKILTH